MPKGLNAPRLLIAKMLLFVNIIFKKLMKKYLYNAI